MSIFTLYNHNFEQYEITTHNCNLGSSALEGGMGLRPGPPVALGQQKRDYFVWVALKKVKLASLAILNFPFPRGYPGRVAPLLLP